MDLDFRLIGTVIALLLYVVNVYLLSHIFIKSYSNDKRWWNTAATTIVFIISSISLISYAYNTFTQAAVGNEYDIVTHYSNDTSASGENGYHEWMAIKGDTRSWHISLITGFLGTWLLDGILIYQCYVLLSITRRSTYILMIPFVLAICSIGSGTYVLIPNRTYIKIGAILHYPLCISTKLLTSAIIIIKLILHKNRLQTALEEGNSNSDYIIHPYTTLINTMIQSYIPYVISSLLFMGLYIANQSAWNLFFPAAPQTGLLSHLLVQYHVTSRKNLADEPKHSNDPSTTRPTSPMRFVTIIPSATSSDELGRH